MRRRSTLHLSHQYCTTGLLGDGAEFRRNGPVLAIHGDNLMKFAPVLGSALAAAAVDGTTRTVADLIRRADR